MKTRLSQCAMAILAAAVLASCTVGGFIGYEGGFTVKVEQCKDKPCEGKKPVYKVK